jgi:hypothetical protein
MVDGSYGLGGGSGVAALPPPALPEKIEEAENIKLGEQIAELEDLSCRIFKEMPPIVTGE